MALHRVILKVQPTPDHPHFYEYECGLLFVWLHSADEPSARVRTSAIVSALPYEVIDSGMIFYFAGPMESSHERDAKAFQLSEELVSKDGFALHFLGIPVGEIDGEGIEKLKRWRPGERIEP